MPTRTIEISDLAAEIQRAWEERGMSGRQVADALGVGPNTPAGWMRGSSITLDGKLQRRLALFLGVSPATILALHGLDASDEVPSDELEERRARSSSYRRATPPKEHGERRAS